MKHRIDIFEEIGKPHKSYFFNSGAEAMDFISSAEFPQCEKAYLLKCTRTDDEGGDIYEVVGEIEGAIF